jgi:tellurite resistance protein TerC
LSFVLIFVGAKMLFMDLYKVPIAASLGIVAGILGLSIAASLISPPKSPARPAPEG